MLCTVLTHSSAVLIMIPTFNMCSVTGFLHQMTQGDRTKVLFTVWHLICLALVTHTHTHTQVGWLGPLPLTVVALSLSTVSLSAVSMKKSNAENALEHKHMPKTPSLLRNTSFKALILHEIMTVF